MSAIAEEILFEERQRFTQWWLWLSLLATNVGVAIIIYNTEERIFFWLFMVVDLLMIALFASLQLQTKITGAGVYVRMFPFSFKYGFYPWEQIQSAYVRQYNPIVEYGGWGVRYGNKKKGRALNVSGNKGLQLEMKDGKKLLIGTQKSDEIERVLVLLKIPNSPVGTAL